MHWVSAIAREPAMVDALDQACAQLSTEMRGDPLDLIMVYASRDHLFDYGRILGRLRENFGPVPVVGCSATSVIGSNLELEDEPGVVLMGAYLPGVQTLVRRISASALPPLDGSPSPWRELIGADPTLSPSFIVLADPFTIETTRLLQGIDYAYPDSTVIGGLASGSQGPGANALFSPDGIEREGAVVLALWGNARIDAIVAQGCRPIGAPARITECDGHVIHTLDGRAPTEILQDLFDQLEDGDRELAQNALQLGVVMNEMRTEVGHGDFLVRNILGMHPESGVMAVGSELRTGQTVQFHVRDGRTAAQDLSLLLDRYARRRPDTEPAAALQFSCLGRGHRLFGSRHHDVTALQESLGPLPAAGFFCSGEIGPVGGSTFVHGYTTAIGIVRPRSG